VGKLSYSRRDYVFKKHLLDNPVTVSTIETEHGFVTFLETVPVLTLRGGAYKQDIVNVAKTKKEGLKYHMEALAGKK
jgi:hypothetical protein